MKLHAFIAGVMLACPGSLMAQSLMTEVAQHNTQRRTAPSANGIDVHFHKTPLREAVRDIVALSKLPVMYSTLQIPADHLVTYSAVQVTGEDALLSILKGTPIRVVHMSDGTIRLVLSATKDAKHQQAEGTIVGRVINAKTKQPVNGAVVQIDYEGRKVTTGEDGRFRIVSPTGTRSIMVRALGLSQRTMTVVVKADETTSVECLLDVKANVLDEVVVSEGVVATARKEIPTPITVITAKDIEQRGITRLEQLFRGEVPGVMALDPGAYRYEAGTLGAMGRTDIYVRGSSRLDGNATPMKVYVDGIEMVDPSLLGTLDPMSVERIEILTGPQAATIYGSDALSGVMQVFTKKGTGSAAPVYTLSLKTGIMENNLSNGRTPSHAHSISMLGGLGPEFSYSGTASYNYSGQWQPALFSRRYGASLGATYSKSGVTVTGSVGITSGRNGTNNDIYAMALIQGFDDGWLEGYNTRTFSRSVGTSYSQTNSLTINYQPRPSWQHHLAVGRNDMRLGLVPEVPRVFNAGDTLYRYRNSNSTSVTLDYNTTIVAPVFHDFSQKLTLGMNGSSAETMQLEGCAPEAHATDYVDCTGRGFIFDATGQAIKKTLDRSRWGVFGQWRVGVADALFVTLGLRGERNRSYGDDHSIDWTPSNGIAYTQSWKGITVRLMGSYGRSTRDPDPNYAQDVVTFSPYYKPSEYVSRFANPRITPEYSRGPQGGMEVYVGDQVMFSINHYQQKITDLIESVIIDSIVVTRVSDGEDIVIRQSQYQNNAMIKQYGWETTGTWYVGPVSLKGTYSWNESRILRRGMQNDLSESFGKLPTHTANVVLSYALGNTNVSLVSNVIGSSANFGQLKEDIARSNTRLKQYTSFARTPSGVSRSRSRYVISDIAVMHRVRSWISATLNITNLGNSYATDKFHGTPAIGRQTLLGVSLRSAR